MNIAIIGAGFAGLVAAKTLKEFGHLVTVYEKVADVGGVWASSRTYPTLSTQSDKGSYCFSDWTMPPEYPEWPFAHQVQNYLASYADHFQLNKHIFLSEQVLEVRRLADGDWALRSSKRTERYDFVVVASGIFSLPYIPDFAGREEFEERGGRVLHTSQFLDPDIVEGKKVLVVGYGKSSCDVATAATPHASAVYVAARQLLWKAPKKLLGVIPCKFFLLTRLGEGLFRHRKPLGFERFLHGWGSPLRNTLISILRSLTVHQFRLKALRLIPDGAFEDIARSTVSLTTDNFFEYVESGDIKVLRDQRVHRYGIKNDEVGVYLGDETFLPADTVIFGTGWRQEVNFLEPTIREQVLDEEGNFLLYNCVLPLNVQGLAFCGYNSSFFSPLSAEIAALWIATYLDGGLGLPSPEVMEELTRSRLAWMAERTDGRHAKGTNIIPFSMRQIDDLLADMGLRISMLQRLREWIRPVRPGDYHWVKKCLLNRRVTPEPS